MQDPRQDADHYDDHVDDDHVDDDDDHDSHGDHDDLAGVRRAARGRGYPPSNWQMHPFEAMSEPARRRIVDVLASGEHTSGQLAEIIGQEFRIGRTAVSRHLRILRDAGFVDVRAELAWRWYRLTEYGIGSLEATVADLRMKWARRIGWDADRLEEFDPLAAPPPYADDVPRRGPGRPVRRATRGRQTEIPRVIDPDLGLFRSS